LAKFSICRKKRTLLITCYLKSKKERIEEVVGKLT